LDPVVSPLDPGWTRSPPTLVSIDGVELDVGTAVAVVVGEDGDPLDGDVYVHFGGGNGDVAGIRPTLTANIYVIYGISAGDEELGLTVGEETRRVPVRVRAR
jgi:hypothetical protein